MSTGKSATPALWALMTGNFVIGTGVMVVPGTLAEISESLRISVPVAGQLISVGAITMGVGAPTLAAVVARWDRRRLLALSMLWFAVFSALCALAPDFNSLVVLRAFAVLTPAVFTPQAAACIGMLVPPEQRGRSITFIFLGWSIASVFGMPLGAWIGGAFGWRAAFWVVAAMGLVSAAWVWRAMPHGVKPAALSLAAWRETLRSPVLMLVVGVTLLSAFGQFVLFSYFAPYYKLTLGAATGSLTVLFFSFGVFGLFGNLLMTRHIDRLGAGACVSIGLALMALSLLVWPLGVSLITAALAAIPWALGCFSSNSAQQARLAVAAPALAGATIALNSSAIYSGQAMGAALGGWMIAQGRMQDLHWVGLVIMLMAMAASLQASRLRAHQS